MRVFAVFDCTRQFQSRKTELLNGSSEKNDFTEYRESPKQFSLTPVGP